jgi:hypothetical protein
MVATQYGAGTIEWLALRQATDRCTVLQGNQSRTTPLFIPRLLLYEVLENPPIVSMVHGQSVRQGVEYKQSRMLYYWQWQVPSFWQRDTGGHTKSYDTGGHTSNESRTAQIHAISSWTLCSPRIMVAIVDLLRIKRRRSV